ncbi:ABC transporter ATP-binding protein [Halobacteriaceae archaeon GCM10025711]
MTGSEPVLAVDDLHTRFRTPEGTVHAVDGASFTVQEGEIVGLVGESGSGKSVTALSAMRLEDPGRIVDGSVRFRGTEMVTADRETIREIRARGMAMVFQDPSTTLNPAFTVGEQIAEALKVHEAPGDQRLRDYLPLVGERAAWRRRRERAVELMAEVDVPDPAARVDAYPHEFSGGMRQRVMLASALARRPDLLIADEPTTALDVTVQAQVLDTLRDLNESRGMAVLLITHDLGVVAEIADRIVVLYGGRVMEAGPTADVLDAPRHPYTEALLDCLPQRTPRKEPLTTIDGEVPDMVDGVEGCPFAPRCPRATDNCRTGDVPATPVTADHRVACTQTTTEATR